MTMVSAGHVCASELKGTIATDPGNVTGPVVPPAPSVPAAAMPVPAASSVIFETKARPVAQAPGVLGVASLPDGLYRASRGRIYVVRSGYKRIVRDLAALRKYSGQPISERPDDVLARYPDRAYLDGDLVRARGTARIYAIVAGRGRPVLTLTELKRQWPGRPINNIGSGELQEYSG